MTQTQTPPQSTALVVPDELDAMIKGSSVGPDTALEIARTFAPIFVECDKALDDAATIKVTDTACVSEMERARTIRLTLKDIRVRGEKAKTAMKADLVPKGRAIDLVFGKLREGCEVMEKWLKNQEELPLRIQAEREAKLAAERGRQMGDLGCDPSVHALGTMPEKSWKLLLAACQGEYTLRVEEERKAREAQAAAERERQEALAKAQAEAAQARKEKEAADTKAAQDRKAAADAQAKLQAEKDAADVKTRRMEERAAEARREIAEAQEAAQATLRKEREAEAERSRETQRKADADAAAAKKKADQKLAEEAKKRKVVENAAGNMLETLLEAEKALDKEATAHPGANATVTHVLTIIRKAIAEVQAGVDSGELGRV